MLAGLPQAGISWAGLPQAGISWAGIILPGVHDGVTRLGGPGSLASGRRR